MATIALAIAGAAIGGAIGGGVVIAGTFIGAAAIGMAVGGLIGSYIDANYIFAPDPMSLNGPRLDDIVLQTATEGRGITEVHGRENRLGAQVLYLSSIRETKKTESQGGGKGGPSVSSTSYSYDCDIALGICKGNIQTQTQGTDAEDAGVRKIFANGKLIYKSGTSKTTTGTFSCEGLMGYRKFNGSAFYYWYTNQQMIKVTKTGAFASFPSGTYALDITGDLGDLEGKLFTKIDDNTGLFIVNDDGTSTIAEGGRRIEGDTANSTFSNLTQANLKPEGYEVETGSNPVINFPLETIGVVWPGPYTKAYEYSPTGGASGEPSGTALSGAATNKDLTFTKSYNPWKEGIKAADTFYTGSQSTANSLIASANGGTAPCWNGIAYLVIEGLELADFGNSVPQFNFIINKSGAVLSGKTYGETVDDVISSILLDGGYTSSQFDVTGIDASRSKNGVYGFATAGALPVVKKLQPLMTWHDIRAREEDGVLFFFDGDNPPTTSASSSELACREETESIGQEFTISDTNDFRLPSEINCTYFDRNKDLQRGSEKVQKVIFEERNVRNYDSNMTSYAGKARQRSAQILYEAEAFRRRANFRLPPDRIDVREGDVISVNTSEDETFSVRAMKVSRGANYVHEVEGIIEGARFEEIDEDLGSDGEGGQDSTYDIPVMTSTVWSGEAVSDEGTLVSQMVFGACCTIRDAAYLGAQVFLSTDFGNTFSSVGSLTAESTLAQTTSVLGDHFDADVIDRTNTVDVLMLHGAVSSVTELNMLNGQNRMWIGSELIGYTTATAQSAQGGYPVFRLSGLLRNLRGQAGDGRMASHTVGELGCVLDNAGVATSVVPVSLPYSSLDISVQFKVVPVAEVETNVVSTVVENNASSAKCHAPGLMEIVRFTGAFDNSGGGNTNLPAVSFATNDVIFRFMRRGRTLQKLFSQNAMPNLTGNDRFRLLVKSGTDEDATVKRGLYHDSTGAITGSTNHPKFNDRFQIVYTAAQQATDFGSAQSSITIDIQQLGQFIELGNVSTVTG